jgi:hypothetical protein
MNDDRSAVFARRMLDVLTGGALSMLVSVGYRTGLFEAAAKGPATSAELAERAGLQERYVREWLGAMVTGSFFDYQEADGRYTLPAAHAALLTGDRAANIAPMASTLRALTRASAPSRWSTRRARRTAATCARSDRAPAGQSRGPEPPPLAGRTRQLAAPPRRDPAESG